MPGMPTTLAAGVPLVAAKSIGDNLKSALLVAGATGALSAAAGSASPEEANAAAFADQARALEDERQARVQQGVQKVNDAFAGFDDSYFDNVRKSADDYYQPQIARQFTEAARQLPFRYATTNSSAYNRGRGFLEEDRARQEADYHAKSQEYADSQRTNIEGARGDLINQVNAGSGVEDAANIAATRAAAIARPPAFSPIADLFQKYTGDAANLALARSAGGASSNFGAPPILFNRGGGSVTYGR